jgi:DNA-binding response OmpR family regulator
MQTALNNDLEPERFPRPIGISILLVDDDVSHLEHQARTLRQEGLHVVSCATYAAALDQLECGGFDLVAVSQGGPSFEGRCVLERAMLADSRTCVLVFASWADMGAYVEAMGLGAVDYLEKPVNPRELIYVIKRHLPPTGSANGTGRGGQSKMPLEKEGCHAGLFERVKGTK